MDDGMLSMLLGVFDEDEGGAMAAARVLERDARLLATRDRDGDGQGMRTASFECGSLALGLGAAGPLDEAPEGRAEVPEPRALLGSMLRDAAAAARETAMASLFTRKIGRAIPSPSSVQGLPVMSDDTLLEAFLAEVRGQVRSRLEGDDAARKAAQEQQIGGIHAAGTKRRRASPGCEPLSLGHIAKELREADAAVDDGPDRMEPLWVTTALAVDPAATLGTFCEPPPESPKGR